ncbi:probable carboxylesterase 11 isoform X2 [Manihot esculenta]|uniref:Uncharacterized protein n=1 Tax=Manihot esculenta TaxID=3983 RepID=A0ACB7HYN4_MANES|nr:probable carboxylesterase 11 isoform X2 [Manihot esculenta]XP_043810522.1 probable carboxylesterase 11 isoform X2 [Manihot esculenta]XP_043811615.1 probable carboxylesterase 11 isoform X2 [Manihot esculenta]KAG8657778.1 hypothetical protein MANES_03G089503v8 [Manihot esculenta]
MPSVIAKLYSVFFKYQQKSLLQSLSQLPFSDKADPFGLTSRPHESIASSNPLFTDGVATKDIHVDPFSSLSLRIFLPETALASPLATSRDYDVPTYGGYSPPTSKFNRKLPVMLQFHGGGFVSGSNDSVANDTFCRRIAKLCDVIVVAVGYRLAPESRYPAAFEDGLTVLNWLAKQANLASCRRSFQLSAAAQAVGEVNLEKKFAAASESLRRGRLIL